MFNGWSRWVPHLRTILNNYYTFIFKSVSSVPYLNKMPFFSNLQKRYCFFQVLLTSSMILSPTHQFCLRAAAARLSLSVADPSSPFLACASASLSPADMAQITRAPPPYSDNYKLNTSITIRNILFTPCGLLQ